MMRKAVVTSKQKKGSAAKGSKTARCARAKKAAPMLQAVGDEAFGFKVREIRELPDVSSRMWRMEYVANGADLMWIEADDVNKTFAVAFRTLPDDDTGIAHIIEHSMLCGSEKFPVKEPFVELLKSSVGSINACTGNDHTCYHASSRNNQDLLNLAEVYLDAVFAPLSVKNDWAMPQERNIVFNEMKGEMSSPQAIAGCEMAKMLFPSNAYGRNFGGNPADISTLTKEQYCEFYNRFYHASNSYIFLYGKVDLLPMLKLIGSYLGRYPRREVPPMPPVQQPVSSEKTIEYPCDTVVDRTLISEGWVFGTWRDVEKAEAMSVVCMYLAGSNDAPVMKALLDAGVCDDFDMRCDAEYQNQIYAMFENVRDGRVEEARRIFRETLERQIREGFDCERIAAKLDRLEFRLREHVSIDDGKDVFFSALGDWIYGGDPAEGIEFSKLIKSLRVKNGTGYYERLAAETLLENPHHALLVMKPTDAPKVDAAVTPETAAKAPEDDPADLARIPRLRLADIPEKGVYTEWKVESVDGVEVVRPLVAANGITYVTLAFAVNDLTDEELLDLPLLGNVLGALPAGGRDVPTLKREIESRLGNFSAFASALEGGVYFTVGTRFLPAHAEDALRLIKDILVSSDFSHAEKIAYIRMQKRAFFENRPLTGGAAMARVRAQRCHSCADHAQELMRGLSQSRHLKEGECGDLAKLAEKVFVRGRLVASVANPPSDEFAHRLVHAIPAGGPSGREARPFVSRKGVAVSDCYSTKGQGASTAMCARLPDDVACSGSFGIAATMLSLDHLWNEVRVKGGAYGSQVHIDRFGRILLTSLRDPQPETTFGVFEKCGDALREYVKSGRSFENYIVSEGGKSDVQYCVAIEAIIAFLYYLDGVTVADMQRWRSEMLHTTPEDLLRFADMLDQVLPNATRCVIGEESLVRKCGLPEFKMTGQS